MHRVDQEFTEQVTTTAEETHALEQLSERLRDKFPDARAEGISRLVAEVHHQYDGRPVRAFIPVRVEREVSEQLRRPAATGR